MTATATLRRKDKADIPQVAGLSGGAFAAQEHAPAPATLTLRASSRDVNPSPYDVYSDDAPWQHAEKTWERYAVQKPGCVFAPRIWESLSVADYNGDLGSTYRLDPATGVIQRLHDTALDRDYLAADGGMPAQFPDGLDYQHEFEPYQDLDAAGWQHHLDDIVRDLQPGDTLIVQTQAVQNIALRPTDDGGFVEGCTCPSDQGNHDDSNDNCAGFLTSDDLVGWGLMARVDHGTP
ncbi:hypothetical protein [Curtobacterium sp. MCBD17_040]|uniref:hypothetical protein n=1 Tax=Curtobacterium sp. MCBD17_040 TaxID=2175674 RepID=UPI0011B712DB|nr:hypothetical protein [Curtobacterium sp. MCBD17_040]WIB65344.1 hypothetical protein DEI94_18225 [Curtobacterium sp. MCBD17_040]